MKTLNKTMLLAVVALLFSFTANAQTNTQKSCCQKADKAKTCCSASGKSECSHKDMKCTHEMGKEKSCTLENCDHETSNHHKAKSKNEKPLEVDKKGFATTSFTVYGNCGMCERTIEGSLKGVKGISLADWDKETDIIQVKFQPNKISLDDIKQKIADVGYDSDKHRAKDDVYNNLPGCCQYERPASLTNK